jgi:hypothetical protein
MLRAEGVEREQQGEGLAFGVKGLGVGFRVSRAVSGDIPPLRSVLRLYLQEVLVQCMQEHFYPIIMSQRTIYVRISVTMHH